MTLLGGRSWNAPPPYAASAENRLFTLVCEAGGGCMLGARLAPPTEPKGGD